MVIVDLIFFCYKCQLPSSIHTLENIKQWVPTQAHLQMKRNVKYKEMPAAAFLHLTKTPTKMTKRLNTPTNAHLGTFPTEPHQCKSIILYTKAITHTLYNELTPAFSVINTGQNISTIFKYKLFHKVAITLKKRHIFQRVATSRLVLFFVYSALFLLAS